jgi:hypothetical protein
LIRDITSEEAMKLIGATPFYKVINKKGFYCTTNKGERIVLGKVLQNDTGIGLYKTEAMAKDKLNTSSGKGKAIWECYAVSNVMNSKTEGISIAYSIYPYREVCSKPEPTVIDSKKLKVYLKDMPSFFKGYYGYVVVIEYMGNIIAWVSLDGKKSYIKEGYSFKIADTVYNYGVIIKDGG